MTEVNIFIFILSVASLHFTLAEVHGSAKVKDEDKAYYIAEVLVNNMNLTKQLWEIGEASVKWFSTIKPRNHSEFLSMDQNSRNEIYNSVLDGIPRILTDEVFGNVSRDVFSEFDGALEKMNFSYNSFRYVTVNESLSDDFFLDLMAEWKWKQMIQHILEDIKPVFDKVIHKDSTVVISVVSHLLDIAAELKEDKPFQETSAALLSELTAGYYLFLQEQLFAGPAYIKNKSATIGKGILKHTNLRRLFEKVMKLFKIVIDKITDEQLMLMLIF